MFFRELRGGVESVHTERCWAQISDALQARDVARIGVCEGGEGAFIKPDKSKSACSTAALGWRGEERADMDGKVVECLRAAFLRMAAVLSELND